MAKQWLGLPILALALTRSFSVNYRRKRRDVWSNNGKPSKCRISYRSRRKLRPGSSLRKKPNKLDKPSVNSGTTSNRLGGQRRVKTIILATEDVDLEAVDGAEASSSSSWCTPSAAKKAASKAARL